MRFLGNRWTLVSQCGLQKAISQSMYPIDVHTERVCYLSFRIPVVKVQRSHRATVWFHQLALDMLLALTVLSNLHAAFWPVGSTCHARADLHLQAARLC